MKLTLKLTEYKFENLKIYNTYTSYLIPHTSIWYLRTDT